MIQMRLISVYYSYQFYRGLMIEKNWDDQVKVGEIVLKNRVVMGTMTRQRCDPELNIPTPLQVEYYSQRAGAGLILTEATPFSPQGRGFSGSACIYNQAHVEGWKKVIDAVHAKGSKIFVQLCHCGRGTHPSKINGMEPIAPSAIAIRQTMRDPKGQPYLAPREMTLQDIQQVKVQFQACLSLVKEAGFDGIQLQGAHGYLIDTFLRTGSNKRTDQYGGSVENRCRFVLEMMDIALKHLESYRIGIKLSPVSRLKDMYDQDPVQTFTYLLKQLDKRKIGLIELRQSTEQYKFKSHWPKTQQEQIKDVCATFRPFFSGMLIGNDSFDGVSGLVKIRTGNCDMISFARYYISNPDLAQRIIYGKELAKWDANSFYGYKWGAQGYTDYPFYQAKL